MVASSKFSQVEDDIPDFPRGGGSSSNRERRNNVRASSDQEFGEEQRASKKRKKEKTVQYRDQSADDDLGSLFGDGLTGKLPKFANKITLKNLATGMKLWGVINEVNEKDIVVSLPGGLRGIVRSRDAFDRISDDAKQDTENDLLSRMYHEGQLVSCIILQIDDDKKEAAKRKIWLSLRLSLLYKSLTLDTVQEGMVLSAYVKSIEDHGFILHFGVSSFQGFLTKHSQTEREKVDVRVGQRLQGVVKSIDRARKVVHLSSEPDTVSKSVTRDLKGISIDLLFPGMMVNARVQSTLDNGIMLSFLTYFTGTVDLFNLDKTLPSSNWKNDYSKNMKFNARILFIDPSSRAVGLTLNPYLVGNRAPPSLVRIGEIFDQCKVVKVDKGFVLLALPTLPNPTPAFVNIADVADQKVQKLDKHIKEGSLCRVRVIGFKHLEGLATATLKTSAIEGSVFTHSDVKPGMVVKAKVIAVDTFGAIVQLASGVKALCPLRHMSELEITKPHKKFQVGVELVFRVLGCKSKRITVTHKKTLVKSKLGTISSYADAVEGLITHGWITKIEKHGCFVRFYNGVQGFVPRSELGLDLGSEIGPMYHVEQVVKCRVVNSNPASHRINVSFIMTPTKGLVDDSVKPGSIVSGTVERITPDSLVVDVNAPSHMKGTISLEHLADHHGLAALLMSLVKPGHVFDRLLVLDNEGSRLLLSAKYSLVNAEALPDDISQIQCPSLLPGYICNIIETGCFVRYIGRLTGFSPKSKATDERISDLAEAFYVGQSVRSHIVDVDREMGRVTLSLKQSSCCSTDASFIQEYFLLEDKIARLQVADSEGPGLSWFNDFAFGNVVEGKVHEIKDFGVVISFENHSDVYGFISHHHLAETVLENNSAIRAVVLDVSKIERLVDLSLKPEIINKSNKIGSSVQTSKKKRKREVLKDLEVNQSVNAVVEIVKENYLVLSVPAYNATIGYASITDYNTQKLPPKHFTHGQSVSTTVMALPAPDTGGRLLLLLESDGVETSSSKRAKKKSSYDVGSIIQAEITEIKPLELKLKFGFGFHGRVHVTEATDENSSESPFSKFKIGQTLTARIVSRGSKTRNFKGRGWELSIKPSLLGGSGDIDEQLLPEFNYSYGQQVSGFVYKIDSEWVRVTISRNVKAQLYILDTSCEPLELADFQKRFHLGQHLSGYVTGINKEKKLLRLVLHAPRNNFVELKENDSNIQSLCHLSEGSVVGGRISKLLPGVGGLLVQIDKNLFGKVHFTELTDSWVPDPLSLYHEGQFVKCKILEIDHALKGTVHVDLSFRSTSGGKTSTELNGVAHSSLHHVEEITDLHPNMIVQGYVKNVSSRGCFIMLSRKIDARILLSNLSDGFVKNPENEFPVGKLVTGRVLSVEPISKRVEVTLKTSNTAKIDSNSFDHIAVGDIVSGNIKRVESYGLFISIDNTNLVGLGHISEISDDQIDDLEMKFKAGERVKARVLKVDKERHRVSLGMKKSYFGDEDEVQTSPRQSLVPVIGKNDFAVVAEPRGLQQSLSVLADSTNNESSDNHLINVLADVESRALVPPLEVQLDEIESLEIDVDAAKHVDTKADDGIDEKRKRREKKKVREEREREIRAAEERLLEKDVPRSADEFEKLIRSSPNSSFLWIKYMAYMLSLAEVKEARSIAERALRTINIREEDEKLNIWVAYFNLENEYGDPAEEAVTKIFQRALQYCDPKKVHFALIGMYERTEQHKLAEDLLGRMSRKFKSSCKVWLRRYQFLLKQNNDLVQSVLNRALVCLPKRKHIKFISHAAILEFKCGVPDRGRSLFEGVLKEYPKKMDLWSVYLDQEIRLGDVDVIRALFERAISLSLHPKKMKFLFKKYLEYETSIGDEERIESVKRKAIDYVETNLA